MNPSTSEARLRLLEALFEEFGEAGPGPNLSMRQVAERAGISHTLLAYHFGSRPKLQAAVLAESRHRDNAVLAANYATLGFAELTRAAWDFFSAPERDDRFRAFFRLAGEAVYEQDAYEDLFPELDEFTRMVEAAARRDGVPEADARHLSVVTVACVRGLQLVQKLNPGADMDAAFEYFLQSLASKAPRRGRKRQPRRAPTASTSTSRD
jgi:AcrR family transcriptional regulator